MNNATIELSKSQINNEKWNCIHGLTLSLDCGTIEQLMAYAIEHGICIEAAASIIIERFLKHPPQQADHGQQTNAFDN